MTNYEERLRFCMTLATELVKASLQARQPYNDPEKAIMWFAKSLNMMLADQCDQAEAGKVSIKPKAPEVDIGGINNDKQS